MIPYRRRKGERSAASGYGVWYNQAMKPLAETNPFIRDPETRRRMLEENANASSVFEGARGLPQLSPHPASVAPEPQRINPSHAD